MNKVIMVPAKVWIPVLIVALSVASYFIYINWPQEEAKIEQLVGNDRDAHGCIGSAGYSWCEVKQKCLRVWEEKCLQTYSNDKYSFEYPSAWNAAVNKYNNKNTLFGPNADSGSGLGGVEIFSNFSSIDNFLNGIAAQVTNKTGITVDGVSGTRANYKGASAGEQVVLLKDGTIYNIYINSEKEQDINYFNQILSTFKFIE